MMRGKKWEGKERDEGKMREGKGKKGEGGGKEELLF